MLKRINDHIIGFEARLFSIILAVFILALWSGVQQWMGKFLFVIHLALFLLWQPFFQKDVPVKYTQALVFLGLLLCMVVTLNYWSLSGWAVFLIGVLGGRVAPSESSEKCYLGFFGILLSILLLVLMPKAVGVDVFQSEQETSLFFGCLLLPLIYSGWIKRESAEVTPDLFQSINAVLFIFFISMGVLVVHAYFPFTYLEALITWLLISSISILLIFWWLFPGGGKKSVRYFIESYLFRINHSSESWLNCIIDMAYNKKFTPENFINLSAKAFIKIEWVKGIHLSNKGHSMLVGEVAKECVEHVGVEYHYRIYSERTLSPAVQFHGRWLMKLLDLLVCAKVREYRLAQQAQIKAIYETGAKLTHDIKNILQALNTFIELVDDVEDGEALPLIRYQLPTLAHRLAHTLAKLNAPAVESSRLEHIEAWWYLVKARYAGREIDFESEGLALISNSDDLINIDVLDSVVENLLENARYKRQSLQRSNSGGANMGIVTRLVIEAGQFSVTVTDEGCAIPAEKSDQLFKQAIESEKGYGIGLYQCAKSARRFGYHLVLSENREGCVQFKISGSLQSKQSTSECLEMGTK